MDCERALEIAECMDVFGKGSMQLTPTQDTTLGDSVKYGVPSPENKLCNSYPVLVPSPAGELLCHMPSVLAGTI